MLPLQANSTTMHGKTNTKAMGYPLLYLAVFVLSSLSSQLAYAATPLDLYVELKGKIQSQEGRELPQYFHLDVYQVTGNGDMILARTGRQIGTAYKTYLRKGCDHILVFDLEGFPYHELYLSKDEIVSIGNMLIMDIVIPSAIKGLQSVLPDEPSPVAIALIEEESVEGLFDTTYIDELVLQSIVLPELVDTIHIQEEVFEDTHIAGLLDTTLIAEPKAPPIIPEQEASPFQKTEYYKSNRYQITTTAIMPLYEKFGGKGEVLTEVTDFETVEVLEQTTSDWWMVEYKTEIGWVSAKQLAYNALTTNTGQSGQTDKE